MTYYSLHRRRQVVASEGLWQDDLSRGAAGRREWRWARPAATAALAPPPTQSTEQKEPHGVPRYDDHNENKGWRTTGDYENASVPARPTSNETANSVQSSLHEMGSIKIQVATESGCSGLTKTVHLKQREIHLNSTKFPSCRSTLSPCRLKPCLFLFFSYILSFTTIAPLEISISPAIDTPHSR